MVKKMILLTEKGKQILESDKNYGKLRSVVLDLDRKLFAFLTDKNVGRLDLPGQVSDDMYVELRKQMESHDCGDWLRLPFAINSVCDTIRSKVREELLIPVMDFKYGGNLQFVLATASFGGVFPYSKKEDAKVAEKINQQMQQMKEDGWAIVESSRMELEDCPQNRVMLEKYCNEKLYCHIASIESRNGRLHKVLCSMPMSGSVLAKYRKPVPHKNMITEPDASILCERFVILHTTLLEIDGKKFMPSMQTLFLSAISCMHSIESILDIQGKIKQQEDIWSRRLNNSMDEVVMIGNDSVAELVKVSNGKPRFGRAWEEMMEEAAKTAESIGLCLDGLHICCQDAATPVVRLMVSPYVYREPPVKIDNYYNRLHGTYNIYASSRNIVTITDAFKSRYPHIELVRHTVKDGRVLREMIFETKVIMDLVVD